MNHGEFYKAEQLVEVIHDASGGIHPVITRRTPPGEECYPPGHGMPGKSNENDGGSPASGRWTHISRREFAEAAAIAVAGLGALSVSVQARAGAPQRRGAVDASNDKQTEDNAMSGDYSVSDEIVKAKIRRALLSGPDSITREATVAEMDAQGKLTVLRPGTNQWVCVPGNENIIGQADMCVDPMGMRWLLDIMAKKPKPSNTEPGLIYMLNGATQHSYTDPFDRTSPAIPIGPHWMIIWPFDARVAGLPTVMRDAGTLVMFAGTPYAHLHVCGSPWDGNEYHPGDRGIWTMTYARPR